MGASSSRRYTSSPDDVATNLTWALTEESYWEEESSHVRVVLSEAIHHSAQQQPSTAPKAAGTTHPATGSSGSHTSHEHSPAVLELQDRADTVLDEVDLVLSREKTLAKKDVSHPKEYPAAHPVHSNLGHRTFASAATEQAASAASTVSIPQLPGQLLAKPQLPGHADEEVVTGGVLGAISEGTGKTAAVLATAPSVGVGATATLVEGAYDPLNTHTASPPAVDVKELSMDPSAFSAEHLAAQSRVELCAKFLFTYGLMSKLAASAQHCFKLKLRGDRLKRSLKPRRTKALEEAAVDAMKRQRELNETALQQSLIHFDKAREAVDWLHRDYELSYAAYRLTEISTAVKELRNSYRYDTTPVQVHNAAGDKGKDTLVDAHKTTRNDADIHHLDALVKTLEERQRELDMAMEHNERRTMDIALEYLDSNNDGHLTAKECPQLPPAHFALLQSGADSITPKSLNAGLMKLSERIGASDTRIKQLANTPAGHVDQEPLRAARAAYQRDRQTLREINSFFHQRFVRQVFTTLDERVKQETVDVAALQRDLLQVEQLGRLVTNPLQPAAAAAGSAPTSAVPTTHGEHSTAQPPLPAAPLTGSA